MTTRRTAGPKGFAKKKQPRGFLPLQDGGGMTGTDILNNYKRIVKNIFGSGQTVNTSESLTAGPTKRKR